MTTSRRVTVFGATGHTGTFLVAELARRGWEPIVSGRDSEGLRALSAASGPDLVRPAVLGDPASLDRALEGAAAVINCAGPFAVTAGPVIEAALRARVPYLDVAAEIEANVDAFEQYGQRARDAESIVLPSMAFYGGLGDLLATAAVGDWPEVDEVVIAYGVDSWEPTAGTRTAGQVSRERRGGRRLVFAEGRLQLRTDSPPRAEWTFPDPLGSQPVVGEFTMADTVTIARHVNSPVIRSFMTVSAIEDLTDPDSSAPAPVDDSGRSAQTFIVEVVARAGSLERRVSARGRDIYAVTAPIVVEAMERSLVGLGKVGVFTAGEAFDAREFLTSLSPTHMSVTFGDVVAVAESPKASLRESAAVD